MLIQYDRRPGEVSCVRVENLNVLHACYLEINSRMLHFFIIDSIDNWYIICQPSPFVQYIQCWFYSIFLPLRSRRSSKMWSASWRLLKWITPSWTSPATRRTACGWGRTSPQRRSPPTASPCPPRSSTKTTTAEYVPRNIFTHKHSFFQGDVFVEQLQRRTKYILWFTEDAITTTQRPASISADDLQAGIWCRDLLKMPFFIFMQDYETFFDAKEDDTVYAFLGLPPPPGTKVGTIFSFLLSWSQSQNKIISFKMLL